MNIKINSIKELWNKDQLVATITVDELFDGKPFDYFMATNKEEDTEVYQFLLNAINTKQVEVLPPPEEYAKFREEELTRRNECEIESLLRSTDQFMTIDTELTEDEIKEMKSYRSLLRSILKSSDLRSLTKSSIPSLPKFLKQNQNHITYIGSDISQEK